MKIIFILLTIGFVVAGFFFSPFAYIGAVFSGILAIGIKPAGIRADQTTSISGLSTGIHTRSGSTTGTHSLRDCPFCLQKIKVDARKCPHCGEYVEPTKGFKICTHCGAKNRMEAVQCWECKKAI